ncbi:M20/M25/M40 family metallo-hydrolase [Bacillus massilinigeriensis]|uniref:M20/M25/M40 family metallo-hydrolase n=1 Tax=Bacillus massilionigeriensis TaxID=1805475 RepID=UPI00096B1388|nr:M20/M25/M40 family metallo-hydrolase [Bacillus massilionigeriensis]
MNKLSWGSPEALRELLLEVVGWESLTLSDGEKEFPIKLKAKLQTLKYFQNHPSHLELHPVNQGRSYLTALYKHPNCSETIVLLSHFDTVSIEEYGDLRPYAYQPEALTKLLRERIEEFPKEVQTDLESGNYLFGRGTMDMKMGIIMHMSLIEKASVEKWPINLLLVTVPDEEVNSEGMRAAVKKLLEIRDEHALLYKLFLNGEPVFTKSQEDQTHYVYSGSMGKIMPSALFYGKETHVGEPLRGITANYIASFLTQKMEWNKEFQETEMGESTPLPVTLQQKDLKKEYSVQTPYRASALYNVCLLKRNAAEIMDIFEETATQAANACNQAYQRICHVEGVPPIGEVQVFRFEKLLEYAISKFGEEQIQKLKTEINKREEWDDREKSLQMTDALMIQCQELAPAIVLFYSPPYYPSVNSSDSELIIKCLDFVKAQGLKKFNLPIEQIHYFNGICDLSYVNYQDNEEGWMTFVSNTPIWGESYSIPFDDMAKLQAPVLNIGPFGKDAHKRTERLHMKNAFEEVPALVEDLMRMLFERVVED